MIHRVNQYIKLNQLLVKGNRVLVCISGGADSVALLDVLQKLKYQCIAAHCNFHLRGEESNRDEQFVRTLCNQFKVPLYVQDFDTLSYARTNHISIEMAARQLRYRWFAEVAHQYDCHVIAVAHHRNDQAETLILNLLRGAGIRGLSGMRPIAVNPEDPLGIRIIRPLLCTTRDYIEHYLRDKCHLTWVEDTTNRDTTIPRNAIRSALSHCSKAEIENIALSAQHLQGYVDWLEGNHTREAGIAQLYEVLRRYEFPEIDKMYDSLQKGVGGKVFYAPHHTATLLQGQFLIKDNNNNLIQTIDELAKL